MENRVNVLVSIERAGYNAWDICLSFDNNNKKRTNIRSNAMSWVFHFDRNKESAFAYSNLILLASDLVSRSLSDAPIVVQVDHSLLFFQSVDSYTASALRINLLL
jgi:hypothetical protein